MDADRVIDADGHVIENFDELYDFLDGPLKGARLAGSMVSPLPWLDGWHTLVDPARWAATDARRWGEFLDATGIAVSVLFPTAGLGHGVIENPDWAVQIGRAYNRWLHATHLARDARLRAVALLPVQDISAAVAELRAAVTELGFVGALLPSVSHLGVTYGDARFDPIFAEAERLDVPVVLHGGSSHGLDVLQMLRPFGGTMPLHHPLPLLIHLQAMPYGGTFERFPNLRVGYFEAGSSWIAYMSDRLQYMYGVFKNIAPQMLAAARSPQEILAGGRIYVTCEANERFLDAGLRAVGEGNVLYASDFPHELEYEEYACELRKLLAREDLPAAGRAGIAGRSAARFYRLA